MNRTSGRLALAAAAVLCASALAPAAQAEDFFTALFGGFGGGRSHVRSMPMPFANEAPQQFPPQQRYEAPRPRYGVGQAFCVRTCDGRYFPAQGSDKQSRAASCNSFCPASDTKVVYGSNIDNAATESGKPYSELPNAYRFRETLVAGCTCNGTNVTGLAPVEIEDDPTLHKGDIVASEDGLMVAGRKDKRSASLQFSPASERIRARYQRVPVMAKDD